MGFTIKCQNRGGKKKKGFKQNKGGVPRGATVFCVRVSTV